MSPTRLAAFLICLVLLPSTPAFAQGEAGWKDGFYVQSADGKFKVHLTGRVQARITVEAPAPNTIAGLLGSGQRSVAASFNIPRARIGMKGHLFTEKLRYVLEIDFGKGVVSAKKVYVDYSLVDDWLQVRAGHYKKPFSRQQLTSSAKQGLLDRSITDSTFGAGYDIGVMLHNGKKQPLEWAVAFMNGTGVDPSSQLGVNTSVPGGLVTTNLAQNYPDLFNPMLVGRIAYNHAGIAGYDEIDRKGGGFRFAIGGGTMLNFGPPEDSAGSIYTNIDAIFKAAGVSATAALYLSATQSGETFSSQSLDRVGFHLQAGYLIAGRVFPAFRYARAESLSGSDEVSQEVGVAVSVLAYGHHVKWVTDVTALAEEDLAPEATDFRIRSQIQVSF